MALRIALAWVVLCVLPLFTVEASGDGSLLAQAGSPRIWYLQGDELWAMSLDGGSPLRIAAGVRARPAGCESFFVSPDRRRVAFQLNDGQLIVANADGGDARNIAAGQIRSVAWSRDSQRLVYDLNDDLYVASASGEGSEPLATGGGRFFYPAFAPDGQHLAFLEAPGGNVFNVNVIRVSSGEWRSLGTTAPSPFAPDSLCASVVKWSPDSTRLLVDYGQPVFVFYLAGGTPTGIGGQGNADSHFWSPAGNLLAFKEGDGSLWLANPDGSGQRPLVAEPIRHLAWNPGSLPLIAYSTTANGLGDLWVVNVQNGQKLQLTGGDTSRELTPAWTPDGGAIIFERRGLDDEEQGIWRVSIDGSGLTQLSGAGAALQVR
jgi:Tol biopolymer transport system component